MKTAQLLDHRGEVVRKAELRAEVAAATTSGVRSPTTGYPGDGLTPSKLGSILKAADAGDAIQYLELAETIEERDPHYSGVLRTRRLAVSQLPVTVKPASDDAEDVDRAKMVEDWLDRDELADEIFDILDTLGKGYSATEILWDTSEGQWMPRKLELRDPRWFRFDRFNLTTPLLLGENGQELPMPAFKFIFATIKAKSGLPIRAGLARIAVWPYLFKKFTERDWAIFTQTYGQPLRVGKFGPNASEEDKRTLLRAVSNIAGDCAAIVPESMMIEFIEAANVGAAHALYKDRAEWLDEQVSKLVLGQTATTDAKTGGLGSGKEHRQVQEDIERADAKALGAVLNRDLIQPWMQLNFGPQKTYPRLIIAREESEDLKAMADALGPMIDRGLEVEQDEIREKFGLSAPKAGAKLMRGSGPVAAPVSGPNAPSDASTTDPVDPNSKFKGNPDEFKRGEALSGTETALNAEGLSTARKSAPSVDDVLAARMQVEAAPAMEAMLAQIEEMMAKATSLPELREMLLAGFPDLNADTLAQVLAVGLLAADLGGRVAVETEAAE
jgi:phage gp29-like protein